MTLKEIIDDSLEEDYVIEEGLTISPAIFFYAFSKPISSLKVTAEKIKARTGIKSGKGENATIYRLNPEQKEFLKGIRHKYGSAVEDIIKDFRNNTAAAYNVVKRGVDNYGKSTSMSRFGMSKDEYLRKVESGKNKILRMGDKENAFITSRANLEKERNNLDELRRKVANFSESTMATLTPEAVEKLLSTKNLGRDDFQNVSIVALEKQYNKLKRYQEHLDDPKNADSDKITMTNSGRKVEYSRKEVLDMIRDIREYGYLETKNGKVYGKTKEAQDMTKSPKEWQEAFNRYMLRKEVMKDFQQNFSRSDYVKVYKDILLNELKNADKRYQESKTAFYNVIPRHKLDEKEAKIWKLKRSGKMNSGDINDWYLAIRPEDFGTIEIAKPRSVERAEYEFKKATKEFEGKLSKILDEEELEKLKELRLIDNFITVKIKKEGNFTKDVVHRKEKTEESGDGEKNDTERKSDE